MGDQIQVFLFGSLKNNFNKSGQHPIPVTFRRPGPLGQVLDLLDIPHEQVHVAMINFKAVPRESIIFPGDRVSFFPREYPFFPDWKDLRF
ncbi:MAG: MoaD/ThiS family protein [Deltaproteobacteria bacterium]|nr:MoaD/ThiS family protein [Deltaproteobacteria bacterium]